MRPATQPRQRPSDARLLLVRADGSLEHVSRGSLAEQLRRGDLLVANDAATLPASLSGHHVATGRPIEVRLAGRDSLDGADACAFTAVVFGSGDFRTRTEDRPAPPALRPGDELSLGPLSAVVVARRGHSRLVRLRFRGSPDLIWDGITRHGRPIQYAHVPEPLALWDVWSRIAARPVAFEPPSAGFVLDWALLASLEKRGIAFATVTLAAGISSTGDAALDRRLPLDEPYDVPTATVSHIQAAKARGARVVALGTTVVRALERAADPDGSVRPGPGVASGRIGPETELRIVDAIITGVHQPGESHHELLRAFAPDPVLRRAAAAMEEGGYRSHEFGDSMLVERRPRSERFY